MARPKRMSVDVYRLPRPGAAKPTRLLRLGRSAWSRKAAATPSAEAGEALDPMR